MAKRVVVCQKLIVHSTLLHMMQVKGWLVQHQRGAQWLGWMQSMAKVHMAWGCTPLGWRKGQVSLAWVSKQLGLRQRG